MKQIFRKATGRFNQQITLAALLSILTLTVLSGCGGNAPQDNSGADSTVTVQSIWQQIEAKSGELPMLAELDSTMLNDYYGLSAADLKQFTGRLPMINTQAEEYFIAQVQLNKMNRVEEGIKKRQADLDKIWSQYLPDQYEKVKNAKTAKQGDFIIFVVSENPQIALDAFHQAFK